MVSKISFNTRGACERTESQRSDGDGDRGGAGDRQAIAIELAHRGANVAMIDILDGQETVAAVEQFGASALFLRSDVSDRRAMERVFGDVTERFGGLDIMVNNAAMSIRKPLVELEVEDIEKTWARRCGACSIALNSRPG